MCSYSEIALIDVIRHLRARFRVDGIEAMSRGISGQMYSSSFETFYAIFD